MSIRRALVELLCDGERRSGVELGRALGVSRAAVSKTARGFAALGVAIDCSRSGYRLSWPTRPLDIERIRAGLRRRDRLEIEILDEVASTSAYLLYREPQSARACLAEVQTQGRGRRGRGWISTPYANIILSFARLLPLAVSAAAGL